MGLGLAGGEQLGDVGEALELDLADAVEGQVAPGDVDDRPGDEHLAAGRARADTGRQVHGAPVVVAVAVEREAVVQADPGARTVGVEGPEAHGPVDERPLPRIGMHFGEVVYRDGDYYGREGNLSARVVARAAGGEVLVTRSVVDAAKTEHLRFDRIGEVKLKGFRDATELFLAHPAAA